MADTWNTTVTNKGIALQTKQTSGAALVFKSVVAGTGSVPITVLKEQTAVSNVAQTLSMEGLKILENRYTITVLLNNSALQKGYYLSQIGFYAADPDEGDILFAIAQIDEPRKIPAISESPGYGIEFSFTFQNTNDATVEITPDMAGYMTRGEAEALITDTINSSFEEGPTFTD